MFRLPGDLEKRGGSAKSRPRTEATDDWQRFFYTPCGGGTWPASVAGAGVWGRRRGGGRAPAPGLALAPRAGLPEGAQSARCASAPPPEGEVRPGRSLSLGTQSGEPTRSATQPQPEGPRSTIPSLRPFPKPIYQLYFEGTDFLSLDSGLKVLQFGVYKFDFTKLMFVPPSIGAPWFPGALLRSQGGILRSPRLPRASHM